MEHAPQKEAPTVQKNSLRRWSIFFVYVLLLPLALQLFFGAFTFNSSQWLNWGAAFLLRLFTGAVFLIPAHFLPRKGALLWLGTGTLFAGFFNLLDLFLLINFGSAFDLTIWQLMGNAPRHEVKGFFKLFLLRFSTLGLLLIYPVLGFIIFSVKKRKGLFSGLLLLSGAILLFFNSAVPEVILPRNPVGRLKDLVQSWQSLQLHKNLEESAQSITASNSDEEALYMLVIGESHSRRRSSLYGFPLNTTPNLKRLYEEKQIFRFDDAVTPHVMTHLALPCLLTFAGNTEEDFSRSPALIDLFRKSGFKVWYIFNQLPDSEKALPFLAAAKRADYFISFSGKEKKSDGEISELLKNILASPEKKKFIIVHLLGNHWEYKAAFPREETFFVPRKGASLKEKIIADYDNSLRYLDRNLAEFIKLLETQKCNSFLLYLPDHGESLYEVDNFVGHTDLFPTAAAAEIPLVLWLSASYGNPEIRSALARAQKLPFYSADLPHFLGELAGITTPLIRPELSILNPAYKKRPRRVSTRNLLYSDMKATSKP